MDSSQQLDSCTITMDTTTETTHYWCSLAFTQYHHRYYITVNIYATYTT